VLGAAAADAAAAAAAAAVRCAHLPLECRARRPVPGASGGPMAGAPPSAHCGRCRQSRPHGRVCVPCRGWVVGWPCLWAGVGWPCRGRAVGWSCRLGGVWAGAVKALVVLNTVQVVLSAVLAPGLRAAAAAAGGAADAGSDIRSDTHSSVCRNGCRTVCRNQAQLRAGTTSSGRAAPGCACRSLLCSAPVLCLLGVGAIRCSPRCGGAGSRVGTQDQPRTYSPCPLLYRERVSLSLEREKDLLSPATGGCSRQGLRRVGCGEPEAQQGLGGGLGGRQAGMDQAAGRRRPAWRAGGGQLLSA
jgi:hypothetical protein